MNTLRGIAATAVAALIVAMTAWTLRPAAPAVAKASPAPRASTVETDAAHAKALLADLRAEHPLLDGVTVRMGETPSDEQAVAYFREGEIVVSPDHTASIDKIIAHEIWHVIDWRDNGRIDWGEAVPPTEADSYQNQPQG